MNTMAWLVRREFWENRAIWMIPAVMGGLMILAALFSGINHLPIPPHFPGRTVGEIFMVAVSATFFAVMAIYSTWYLLECLYADRKDRSILFWKSLPISDSTTVISKLLTGLIVLPVVYFAAADLTTLIMAFIVSVRAGGIMGGVLWHADLWLQLQALWVYLILATAVWYLPVAGYFLVVSAWAKRAVMLWALLPPLALLLLEKWFLGTQVVAHQLTERLWGVGNAFNTNPGEGSWVTTVVDNDTIRTPADVWGFMNISGFLASPDTWIGVVVGVALIAGAIQLRRRRAEI